MTRRTPAALMRGAKDRSRDNTYDAQSACSSDAGRPGRLESPHVRHAERVQR